MAELQIGGASLTYAVRGTGPGLLVPLCNFPWLDVRFLEVLAAHFTVVTASPRGYQASTRIPEEQQYSTAMLIADLLAVCDHVGLETFPVLGYSFTAAVAARLALASTRVDAVVAGGFPFFGSYERVLLGAERDTAALSDEAAAAMRADFDVRAVLTFYRELAALRDGALVAELRCPMLAFWGTDDDILWSFNTAPHFAQALADRGLAVRPIEGRDHAGTILGFGEIVESVCEWLLSLSSAGQSSQA
jgi:pimeloyl-ACP methyl ester carboxylesterase